MLRFFLSRRIGWGFRAGISMPLRDLFAPRQAARAYAKPPGSDFVYAITSPDGFVKVGCSNDPQTRLAQLQLLSPVPLTLAYVVACKGDARIIERATHALLSPRHHRGEWFAGTTEMAIAAIAAASHRMQQPVVAIDLADLKQVVALVAGAGTITPRRFDWALFISAMLAIGLWLVLTFH